MQVCCPEFNVGMCFIGTVRDDEVVSVLCRRFTKYSGYSATFQCGGYIDGTVVQYVLCLDACRTNHFTPSSVLRDVRKAYTAFASLPRGNNGLEQPLVSTGRWGCGIFGGLPAHKLVQQVCAASLAGVDLAFSLYGMRDGCDEALDFLRCQRMTVAQTWKLLSDSPSRAEFLAALQLNRTSASEQCALI